MLHSCFCATSFNSRLSLTLFCLKSGFLTVFQIQHGLQIWCLIDVHVHVCACIDTEIHTHAHTHSLYYTSTERQVKAMQFGSEL